MISSDSETYQRFDNNGCVPGGEERNSNLRPLLYLGNYLYLVYSSLMGERTRPPEDRSESKSHFVECVDEAAEYMTQAKE